MRPQPLGKRVGRAIWEEIHGLTALQINEHCAIGVAFPQSEIVHPKHPGRGQDRPRQPAQPAQERVAAHGQVPRVAETHAGPAPERHTKGAQALGEPQGTSGPRSRHRGQPFGEDTAPAVGVLAKPFPHPELSAYAIISPGEVGEGTPVRTVNTPRRDGTERTRRRCLSRVHRESNLACRLIDLTGVEVHSGGIG
jgi:hypothetical protein